MGNHRSEEPLKIHIRHARMMMLAFQVSQREVARLAGVAPSTVSKVFRGYRRIRAEKRRAVLLALAERLKCDPAELCLGRPAA